jgi:hypothetical protein
MRILDTDAKGKALPDKAEIIVKLCKSLARININSCVDVHETIKFMETVLGINELDRHDIVVIDSSNLPHAISEYQLDIRLLALAQPRGVFFDVGEVSPDLRYHKGNDDKARIDGINALLDAHNGSDRYGVPGSLKPMVHIDEDIAGKVKGYAKVPYSPKQFSAYQAKFFNQFKSSIGDVINMEDATKPALLEDVKTWVDDGQFTLEPDGTWAHLPITLEVSEALYKPYKFSYPNHIYYEEFMRHLIIHAGDKALQK